MSRTVQVGTILMKEWPGMPQLVRLETESGLAEWSMVKRPDAFTLDRKIHLDSAETRQTSQHDAE